MGHAASFEASRNLFERRLNSALPEFQPFGKIYQNGFRTTIKTMTIINTAGASFMIRQ
jgi:hypothetical protein